MKYNFCLFFFLFGIFLGFVESEGNQTPMSKKKILFIVNPISHKLKGQDVEKIINENINKSAFDYKIVFTKSPNHAYELSKEAANTKSADIVASIGGDGTVNEVGKALLNTGTALAIIPAGSGNGLARHLKIPQKIPDAIKALDKYVPVTIDTGKINDRVFLGMAGIGFDGHIAGKFAQFRKRGLTSYLQLVLKEYAKYETGSYSIIVDGKQIFTKALVIAFANSSQYGNNIIVASQAKLQDGFLEMVIVKEVPVYALPQFIMSLKQGTVHKSSYAETIRFKEAKIKKEQFQAHFDGEPVLFTEEVNVKVVPGSLKIMVPA
jgi:diacylglycerol kinase (ATP)